MSAGRILEVKGDNVVTVRSSDLIGSLAERLRDEHIGVMVVSDDGSAVDGIISERDIAYGLATYGAVLAETPVSQLMIRSVVTCAAGDSIAKLSRLMIERNIRHLPVMDGARLVGIISMRDVLKFS